MMPHHWRPLAHEQNSIFKCKQHTCILHDPWGPEKYDYTISVPTIIALLLSSKPFDLYEVLFLRLFEKVWVLYDFRYMAIQFFVEYTWVERGLLWGISFLRPRVLKSGHYVRFMLYYKKCIVFQLADNKWQMFTFRRIARTLPCQVRWRFSYIGKSIHVLRI